MAHKKPKRKKKPNIITPGKKKIQDIDLSKEYPFVNPVILSSDGVLIDGVFRRQVCIKLKCPMICYKMMHSFEQRNEEGFTKELRAIQAMQRVSLEDYFQKNNMDYKRQLLFCSSLDKMDKFIQFENRIESDIEYWQLLASSYITTNNNLRLAKELKRLFLSERSNREYIMSQQEREFLNNLPDTVTIFRGMSVEERDSGDFGVSWSLKRSVAEKFAHQFMHNYDTQHLEQTVMELTINKRNIIAYLNERGEDEIIYIHKR